MALYFYKTPSRERGIRRCPARSNAVGCPPVKSCSCKGKASPMGENNFVAQPPYQIMSPYPFGQYFDPICYSLDNPYLPPVVTYATPHATSDHISSSDQDDMPPLSPLTPALCPPATAMSPVCLNDPPIPLQAAARQLLDAVTQAIDFFNSFYQAYRGTVTSLRAYGDKDLLNKCWAAQIRSSIADPSQAWTRNGANNRNNQDRGDVNNQLSFLQHQKLVIERIEAFQCSVYPLLPQQAAVASSNAVPDWPDAELYANQQQHRAAETLKRKVKNGYEDLAYAVQGMRGDYELAKIAIRELKCLKQNLNTYKACWKKDWKWENDDGADSDNGAA